MSQASVSLVIDAGALRDLVADVVRETLAAIEAEHRQVPGDRLAYSESEAARLLGLNVHQLRDERLRGRVAASVVVGKRIRYLRDDLLVYLRRGRVNAAPAPCGDCRPTRRRRPVADRTQP